ncbi:hypothetical protein D9613_003074 [Agrocybe pediades]|uniref:Kinesin motor domain-containing protein n=1 Tax=Agrocybe pediades TaxID=84607 RepID=A0A8H4QQE6_9AGAR|nr:hypothetical protein D9613_003074 [Agrocybe pediades]
MATRRPPSSRGRPNSASSTMPPPAQMQRPKSVMSRVPSTSRGEEADEPSSSRAQKDGRETNIKVILRCRGRTERELNSPSVVDIAGAKSKDLTIETTPPVSSLGLANPPGTRTYPFDLVFGPEATQSMIYHDVVGPMLKEVMDGYNCTLFAYGQTGTGKTYTMQGDLAPTPMGNPSSDAGIIPRTLFRLFHELEKAYTDYVVKISFIELYNEELRDLLSNDLLAPTNLMQPMGMAAKDAKSSEEKLKIFDDPSNKRAVVIQGLEEIAVKDSRDALALLTKGSERRQIAATKFNDHSSRSHSVFSITVHTKEVDITGSDLLKVGKLNLVDLAGSENVGRSGAEHKRAREAGMINQSLLTLGRVINALVDNSSHVPYRESKLTRILQDSLGGSTKTCIIATISPARSNLEETLSTLDYALRAKSIKNKPLMNRKMERHSLLKEYAAEIERLKADLVAAREKNGIYFSEETWNQIITEKELRATELKEAQKQVEIIENQMRSVRDEYDQSIAVLKRREEELQDTRNKLKKTEETLALKEVDLRNMTDAYEQEVIVRQAHQDTETHLNDVAIGLRNTAEQSLQDLSGVFDKLERKNAVLTTNKRIVSENERLIRAVADSLTKRLAELSQILHATRNRLQDEAAQFDSSQREAIIDQVQKIDSHFGRAQELFEHIENQEEIEDKALANLRQETEKARHLFNTEVASWSNDFNNSSKQLCDSSTKTIKGHVGALEHSNSVLHSLIETISRETYTYINDQQNTLDELQLLAKTAADKEIAHLRRQNEVLAEMLVEQRKDAERSRADLLQSISSLLGEFMQKRDDTLRRSVDNLQSSNKEVEDLLASTYERQSSLHANVLENSGKLTRQVEGVYEQSNGEQARATQSAKLAHKAVDGGMEAIQSTVVKSLTTHSVWVNGQTKTLGEATNAALEEHQRAKRARIEASDTIHANLEGHHAAQQAFFTSSLEKIEKHTSTSISWIKEQAKKTDVYEDEAVNDLDSIAQASSNILNKGIKDDMPTGSTPRKRKWQYEDEWSLTKSRNELLSDWRHDSDDEKHIDSLTSTTGRNSVASSRTSVDSKHRNEAVEVENAGPPLVPEEKNVVETPKTTEFAAAPLVESRKRNFTTTRTTRRMR